MKGLNLSGLSNQELSTPTLSSLNLKKGMSLDLTKKSNLKRVRVGLGWKAGNGVAFDLDASAISLNKNGIVNDSRDVVFYNQENPERGIQSLGDNKFGSVSNSVADDETILANLDEIPRNVEEVLFVVTIHEAVSRKQNFGMVKDAYIRIVDEDTEEEICRYNMTEDFSMQTACEIAKLSRTEKGWIFTALGKGTNEDLMRILIRYGVQ